MLFEIGSSRLLRYVCCLVLGLVVFSLAWVAWKSAYLPYSIYLQLACVALIFASFLSLILSLRLQRGFVLMIGGDGQIALRLGRSKDVDRKNNSGGEIVESGFVVSGVPVFWHFLIVLDLKSSEGKVVHLLIVRDSMSASAFHQLKVALVSLSVQQYRRKKTHLLDEFGNF